MQPFASPTDAKEGTAAGGWRAVIIRSEYESIVSQRFAMRYQIRVQGRLLYFLHDKRGNLRSADGNMEEDAAIAGQPNPATNSNDRAFSLIRMQIPVMMAGFCLQP